MSKYSIPEEQLKEIAKHTEKQIVRGQKIAMDASNEALDYISGILDGEVDKRVALDRNGVMLGVVEQLVESVIPDVYRDMNKTFKKRPMKMPSDLADAICNIFLARMLSNVMARLEDERD